MKLQDAYAAESNQLGTWQQIGYNAPNDASGSSSQSTNFMYGASTATVNQTGNATWGAYNRVALNDCSAGSSDVWTVKPDVTDGSVSWTADISGGVTGDCGVLTPNFVNIGK